MGLKIWQYALLGTAALFVLAMVMRSFMADVRKNSKDVVAAIHSELFTLMQHNATLAQQLDKLHTTVQMLNRELKILSEENGILRQEVNNLTVEISILSKRGAHGNSNI